MAYQPEMMGELGGEGELGPGHGGTGGNWGRATVHV